MNRDTLEQDPCNTCGYEEGSIYCKEHCPHEAKIEQETVFFPPCQDCNTKMDEIRRAYDKLQEPSGDAIDRKIISAFLSGLISDETERKKALQYINELPSVNPQPCEDVISRQAVIDLAKKGVLVSNGNYKSVCKAINELPSVNPTKTGHWINLGVQGEIDGQIVKGFTCSKCGAISVFRMTDGKIINGDLCANCGAKMIESQERSDKE